MNRLGLVLMVAGGILVILPLSGIALSVVQQPCPSTVAYATASGSGTGTLMSAPATFAIVQQYDPTGTGVSPVYWAAWQQGGYGGLPALWSLTTSEGSIAYITSPASITSTGWSTGFTFLSSSQSYASFAGGGWSSSGACTVMGVLNSPSPTTSTSMTSTVTGSGVLSSYSTSSSSTASSSFTATVQTTSTVITTVSGTATTIVTTYFVTTVLTTTAPQGPAVQPPPSSVPSAAVSQAMLLVGLFMFGAGAFLVFHGVKRK